MNNETIKRRLDSVWEKYKTDTEFKVIDDKNIQRFTFRNFREMAQKLKTDLDNCNISEGDRVAVFCELNVNEWLFCTALLYFGITAVVIDASLSDTELARLIELGDVIAVIGSSVASQSFF